MPSCCHDLLVQGTIFQNQNSASAWIRKTRAFNATQAWYGSVEWLYREAHSLHVMMMSAPS